MCLVVAVGLMAALPALAPATVLYVDNAAHLLEVQLLADALPQWRWFHGWSDVPLAGLDVGQLNAPLCWLVLALGARAGLPLEPLYLALIPLSNAVLALGAWGVGRRVWGRPAAAVAGAVLAASAPVDLWGVTGAAAGMWPFRLGCGLLLAGLAWAPRRAAALGLWTAVCIACHTYVGLVALGVAGVFGVDALRRGERGPGRAWLLGPALGLGVTAGFWGPLLDPAVRGFGQVAPRAVVETLLLLSVPLELYLYRALGQLNLVAETWGVTWTGLVLGGAVLWLVRARPTLAERDFCRMLVIATLGLVALSVAAGLAGSGMLGPNPWRHFVWWRLLLCGLAGGAVAQVPFRWVAAGALAVGLGATAGGLRALPDREEAATVMADLEALWQDVADRRVPGRVYHQDPFMTPGAPVPLIWTHPGGLLAARHGLPVLGSWYGVTPSAVHRATSAEGTSVWGVYADDAPDEWLYGQARLFGVGVVVTVEPALRARLAADDRYGLLTTRGAFSAFEVVGDPVPAVGARAGGVEVLEAGSGRVRATLASAGPFRIRQGWHPWWQATLDGQPLGLHAGERGLVEGVAPQPGLLEARWVDQGRAWRWVSLLGLLALVGVGGVVRVRGRPPSLAAGPRSASR